MARSAYSRDFLSTSSEKDRRTDLEVSRQGADLSPVQIPLARQDLGDRGIGNRHVGGEFRLCDPAGIDEVAKHRRIGDRWHRVLFGLVFLDDVREDVEIVLLAIIEVPSNDQRIDNIYGFLQILIRPQGTKGKLQDEIE